MNDASSATPPATPTATPPATQSPLLVVAGPTASGKSSLAIALALEFGGEIISCDSVAVYREFEIGTAKPSPRRTRTRPPPPHRRRSPRRLVHRRRLRPPGARRRRRNHRARTPAHRLRRHRPLPPRHARRPLRRPGARRGSSPAPASSPPSRFAVASAAPARPRIRPAHPRQRRAQAHPRHRGLRHRRPPHEPAFGPWPRRHPGLPHPAPRPQPPARRTLRAHQRALRPHVRRRDWSRRPAACSPATAPMSFAMRSLGYRQAASHLRGECGLAEAISAAQQGHRNYAKRQLTWFRREAEFHWLEDFGEAAADRAAKFVRGLLA